VALGLYPWCHAHAMIAATDGSCDSATGVLSIMTFRRMFSYA
jgi:hypothetical protein